MRLTIVAVLMTAFLGSAHAAEKNCLTGPPERDGGELTWIGVVDEDRLMLIFNEPDGAWSLWTARMTPLSEKAFGNICLVARGIGTVPLSELAAP